ncbi:MULTISPECIES: helix-turn-helix domain-containing protein [Pandoraea]|uniref:helix-turn-helix domain-containing protein n=1 Tax=Pandoraea TaxID=93217 RepID=UPI001581D832|nr:MULTISPECIES: helix-turn-helix domain-containing protein [Pandoraea]
MPDIVFSTSRFPEHLRNHVWRDAISPLFEFTPVDGTQVEGRLWLSRVGELLIGKSTLSAQRYERSRRLVLSSGLDLYIVSLFVSGGLVGDCDGVSVSVRAGDILVLDLSRVARMQVDPGSTATIFLPRQKIDKAIPGRDLHGAVLDAAIPIVRLLVSLINGMVDEAPALAGEAAAATEASLLALFADAVANRPSVNLESDDSVVSRVLRRGVLDYIDANLTSPELRPELIIEKFRVSRAHLYRIFASDGGVASVIRDRRLDVAYRALVLGGGSLDQSITRVAYELAFSGSNHFLRAFRARFGITPSEAREYAPKFDLAGGGIEGLQSHFMNYLQRKG